jgi:hypothetical protein
LRVCLRPLDDHNDDYSLLHDGKARDFAAAREKYVQRDMLPYRLSVSHPPACLESFFTALQQETAVFHLILMSLTRHPYELAPS